MCWCDGGRCCGGCFVLLACLRKQRSVCTLSHDIKPLRYVARRLRPSTYIHDVSFNYLEVHSASEHRLARRVEYVLGICTGTVREGIVLIINAQNHDTIKPTYIHIHDLKVRENWIANYYSRLACRTIDTHHHYWPTNTLNNNYIVIPSFESPK